MAKTRKFKKKKLAGGAEVTLGGFLGGLFDGLEKVIKFAQTVEKAGGELKREGEFRWGAKERPIRGVYGFRVRTGLGKEARIETFGNIKKTKRGPAIVETREPLVDVFDEPDHIVIIAELPGVAEKEISLEVRGDMVDLRTTGERKYAKEILLPAKVDATSPELKFKNGILEVRLKKQRQP